MPNGSSAGMPWFAAGLPTRLVLPTGLVSTEGAGPLRADAPWQIDQRCEYRLIGPAARDSGVWVTWGANDNSDVGPISGLTILKYRASPDEI